MKALIADDDLVTAAAVSANVSGWGFEVVVAHNGVDALNQLLADPPPALAIIDFFFKDTATTEIYTQMRADQSRHGLYVLLLTARSSPTDIVAGLEAGADDYLVKPVNLSELRARIHVGVRVVTLQERLAKKVAELQATIDNVRQLRGLLPICSYCKRIRNDENYWERVEVYVTEHSDAKFTHGICPTCLEGVQAELDADDLGNTTA